MPVMLLKVFTWVFCKVQMADVWRQMAHPPAKFMPDMDPFGISARHWDVATMTILTLWNGRFLVGKMLFFRPVLLIRKLALEPGLIPPLVMRMVLHTPTNLPLHGLLQDFNWISQSQAERSTARVV